jgi:hypothetical protein
LSKNGTISNGTASASANSRQSAPGDISARFSRLSPRADYRFITINAGEGYYNTAARYRISQTQLQGYNRANLCNSLILGERVCYSSGTLPSTLPPRNLDGAYKTR